jgi:protein-S-isoprenylcysteine O-methyltransferase Ste14
MNNSKPIAPEAHAVSVRRGLLRWAIKQTVFVVILALALFIPAGRFDGARAWTYLGLVAAIQVLTALVGYSPVLMALAAGLETRFSAPPASLDAAAISAVLVAILGTAVTLWAMAANPFFSGIVRIQQERGHKVVSAGPYRFIRHPGYAGMLVFTFAAPVILGSPWAFGIAILTTGITVLRTSLEDRTLERELDGYAEYARRVRHRLVPGVW